MSNLMVINLSGKGLADRDATPFSKTLWTIGQPTQKSREVSHEIQLAMWNLQCTMHILLLINARYTSLISRIYNKCIHLYTYYTHTHVCLYTHARISTTTELNSAAFSSVSQSVKAA